MTANFLEGCSLVDWAGDIKREQGFVINVDSHASLMEVKVYNPEAPDRFWADNGRLEEVVLEYRRIGDLSWLSARLANGSIIDFAGEESNFGYAKLNWRVASIPDGNYEIRTMTRCTAAGLDPPEGINQARSTVLTGLIDRTAPKMFSNSPEPSDGMFSAGDKIAVELTESIECSRPFSFDVTVSLGSQIVVGKDALDIVCEERLLEISLTNRFSASTLAGSTVSVVVSGVRDLAQNTMAGQIKWSFVFEEDATAVPANVVLEGVRFNMPYNTSWLNTTSSGYLALVLRLQQDLATALDVEQARIQVTQVLMSNDGQTLMTIVLLPPAAQVARRRALHSGASADVLAYLFMAMYQGQSNQTNGSSFSNSSLLSSIDTITPQPQPRAEPVVKPSPGVVSTTRQPDPGAATKGEDDSDSALKTVVMVFGIISVAQGCALLWLMSATRLTKLLLRVGIKRQREASAQQADKRTVIGWQVQAQAEYLDVADGCIAETVVNDADLEADGVDTE